MPDGHAIPNARDPDFLGWIWTLPCAVAEFSHPGRSGVPACGGDIVGAHKRGRNLVTDDVGELFPCCHTHHTWQHQHGIKTFQRVTGIDLEIICAAYAAVYRQGVTDGTIRTEKDFAF